MLALFEAVLLLFGIEASILTVLGGPIPGLWLLIVLIVAGVGLGFFRLAAPASRTLREPHAGTTVSIQVGDLLTMDAHKAVGVNVHFDSLIGDRVAQNSLHGQVVTNLFNGDSARFQDEVDKNLNSQQCVGESVDGHDRPCYPIGTTAVVNVGPRRLFLPAVCHTELPSYKANADVTDLWQGLCKLWASVRNGSNGEPIAVPLMGSGQAQVRLSNKDLLMLLLMSITHESRAGKITDKIIVVLTPQTYEHIDLRTVSFD